MTIQITVTDDLEACHRLRRIVFMDEQNVPEHEEMDDQDASGTHFLALVDGQPMGTARLHVKDRVGKIGRVCVLRDARGTGLGAALMVGVLDHLRDTQSADRAILGAQTHALAFYEKLGFVAYGPEFDDAGIPHRMMERAI